MGESKDSWLKKNLFSVSSKKTVKDNNKPAHWVVHSKLISLEIDEFFKITPNFDLKEASVTGITEEEKYTDKKLQMIMIKMQKIMKNS